MDYRILFAKDHQKNGLAKDLKSPKVFFKILFFLIGIFSLIWFLIRVIPKPSRATYPCMKAAMPIASSFVIYLLSLSGSFLLFKKIISKARTRQFWYASILLLVVIALSTTAIINNGTPAAANQAFEQFSDPLGPNSPIGEAKGILPGRVVWVYNKNATNENCTNSSLDDVYWVALNTNQAIVDQMFSDGILSVSGEDTHADAWDAIFRYFNNNHGKGDVGYSSSETIFIKINAVTAWGGAPVSGDNYGAIEYDTSPQAIMAMLRQLVNEAGVPQENIYIGDPMCDIYNHIYNVLHAEFPNVNYVSSWGLNNRYLLTKSTEVGITYSDKGTVIDELTGHNFYQEMMDADYLLNIPTMKGHRWAGTTFFAKNHFGSNTNDHSWELHKGLMNPDNNGMRYGYNLYRVQVDLMASQYLGGNTLLYFMDALWSTSYEHQPPQKFETYPWNNDWCSSLLFSLDHVAIESVCLDILQKEFTVEDLTANPPRYTYVQWDGVDDYLHQAASSEWWPAGIIYDPDNSGSAISTIGVHEHWNNTSEMLYSRNLGTGEGIELVKIWEGVNGIDNGVVSDKLSIFPNPCIDIANLHFEFDQRMEMTMEIYNSNGQKVFYKNFGPVSAGKNEVSVVVSKLNSGLYFVRINNEENTYTQRLIVQKNSMR